MRILYLGMDGVFSYPPLKALLARGKSELEIAAVILPSSAARNVIQDHPVFLLPSERPQSELPLVQPYLSQTIIHLAWANQIPVYLVRDMRDAAVHNLIRGLEVDIGCVACFPYLIPREVLEIPRHGFLNIHPSLLPAYRGPNPLFWIFRNGEQDKSGVTLHWVDTGMDTGDIVSQRPIFLPDGISGPEADYLCATLGAEMLEEALGQILTNERPGRPQPSGGSYQPYPTAEDFTLDANWPARRAFNFMRGTAEWNQPYKLRIGTREWTLKKAESFDLDQILVEPVMEKDDWLRIRFNPGILLAHSFP